MTGLTVTPDPDNGLVLCAVVGAAGGDLIRTDPAGSFGVRGGQGITGDLLVSDYDAPFGVPVSYELEDSGPQATQLDPAGGVCAWISHPTEPLGMALTVHDAVDVAYAAPGQVHHILAAPWPVAVWTARNAHTGRLIIRAPWEQRADVDELLASGSPLLLRTTPETRVDDMWFWAARVTREKTGGDPYRFTHLTYELEYQQVAPPVGEYVTEPSNIYDGLGLSYDTYAQVDAAYPTYADLSTTPHP